MEGYLDLPGSGSVRVTTAADVARATEARQTLVASATRPSLTAAAVRVGDSQSEYAKRQTMPWQQRTFSYLDLVPEIDFASRVYARMLKQLIIYPALLDERGKTTPIESGPPVDLLDRIQDPGGGRSQIQGSYGRLMFLPGEGSLFGRDLNTPRERWSFLWNDELKVEYAGNEVRRITHKPYGSTAGTTYSAEQAVVYRMWTPHPRNSGEATSPMRAALDIAEELVILTKAVRATAVGRILNGVWIMPQELSPGAAEPVGDEDALNDPLLADIADVFEAQIENPGSAAAKVPPILWAPYDYIDRIQWVQLHDAATDYMERDLRKEAVERLARGFDFPPEILLGLSSANHWSAKQILDDLWRSHGAPIAEQFCDDLNDAYLRPTLAEAGYPNWRRVVIAYDESKVTVDPDRGADALKAHDALAISDKALRVALNFSEADTPPPAELERRIDVKIRNLQAFGGTPASGNGSTPLPPGPEGDSGRLTRVTASMELGAAQMALINCRKLAGMRIRNKSTWASLEKACSDCAQAANGKPHEMVASLVGADLLVSLGADPMSLVKGGTDTFKTLLASWGYGESAAANLCEMVERYAARTLYDEQIPSLPSGFAAQLTAMKELAEAVDAGT